ncbi:GNAT family N-acetyltransferase [Streptomyces sp. NBC_00094]|uniref:GNAT family N-acetyltransferase n=1 Tax=Streptomyces sp. NBC_00094 TaxID=2903620 RepID=UPI002259A364|nr:GNAT family N-acetyltransferase [Streptomyces sp. NBC_00094]MCX5390366.1 GNAT family N-acetyltransferase [Streptomyces sp. NBC_00094]
MTWFFTEDAAAFRAAAADLLAAEAARNTAVLTLMDRADRLGWWAEPDGRVTGVVAVSPPREPAFGAVTVEAARALVLPEGEAPTAVRGETAAVEAFAEATGRPWTVTVRMRLFRLGELTPPQPAPAGRARVAVEADIPFAAVWAREFARDIGENVTGRDFTGHVTERVTDGRLVLWETPDGRPVSMASVSRTIEDQARVHLVYTPPAERGRGYAAGATEAASRAALDSGATRVLLFTDLANPTSNALYQRLGYRPVTDHLTVEFRGEPAPVSG